MFLAPVHVNKILLLNSICFGIKYSTSITETYLPGRLTVGRSKSEVEKTFQERSTGFSRLINSKTMK